MLQRAQQKGGRTLIFNGFLVKFYRYVPTICATEYLFRSGLPLKKTHSRLVNNSKPGSSTCSEVFAAPSLPVFNVKIERLVKLSGFRLTTSHENSQEHSPSCLPYKPNAPGLGNGKHGICPPKDCISRYTSSPTHSNNQASVTSCATQTGIFHGSCSVPTESTSTLPAVTGREKRDNEHLRKEQKGDTNMNMARLKRLG
ncbi:hypothetical protein GCK32_015192 [Trichostrongylus colubriformis]|uniref:Uncharacterized protein n=1 Tax=Trichostrongylus colubriformis TaxID=6319 RepID=A0AAN8F827_TRICO